MKIVMTAVGTRGDMEPFVATGEILQKKGHRVICSMPGQFRQIAEDSGLEFESLGAKFIELLISSFWNGNNSDDKQEVAENKG